MPRYSYSHKIGKVEHVTELVRQAKDRDLPVTCPECQNPIEMKRTLATVSPPTVLERVDRHRNVKQRQNNAERIRKRAKKYFVEHELPQLVSEHGAEHGKRVGWIKANGQIVKPDDLK